MDRLPADVAVIGFNHKSAAVDKRERFAVHPDNISELYEKIKAKNVGEVVYLATCNRVETYVASMSLKESVDIIVKLYEELSGIKYEEFKDSIYIKYSKDAAHHLMSVISSLDSMVLGETEIVSQLKGAFAKAVYSGTVGPVLNKLFHQAFKAAKQVRSETSISHNPISIAFIAADMVRSLCPNLEKKKALLIGAGQMGELVLKYLVKHGVGKIIVANRSLQHAELIAAEINADVDVILLDEIMGVAMDVDIVITSVAAPHYMITKDMMTYAAMARKNRPLVLIDIAVPRNVEPGVEEIDGVHLYNIDSLQTIANDNLKSRISEKALAEEYINENVEDFYRWHGELVVAPAIASIKDKFDAIRCTELERYKRKKLKHLSPEDFEIVDELTKQIMKKILHNPIMNLKKNYAEDAMDEAVARKTAFLKELFT